MGTLVRKHEAKDFSVLVLDATISEDGRADLDTVVSGQYYVDAGVSKLEIGFQHEDDKVMVSGVIATGGICVMNPKKTKTRSADWIDEFYSKGKDDPSYWSSRWDVSSFDYLKDKWKFTIGDKS